MIQLKLEEFENNGVPKVLKQISIIFIIGCLFYINNLFSLIVLPEWFSLIGQGLILMGVFYFFYLKNSMIKDIKILTNEIRRLNKALEIEMEHKFDAERELREFLKNK